MTPEPVPGCILFVTVNEPEYLQPGELARLAGVSTDTLRHYEKLGLLSRPSRSVNGYRQYRYEALERVRLIRRALGIGFTLSELGRILKVRDRGGVPCGQVRALAQEKLESLEQRIQDLLGAREQLQTLIWEWDERLQTAPAGKRLGLLESLPETKSGKRKGTGRLNEL